MSSRVRERFEDTKTDIAVKNFLGVNRQVTRTALQENEFYWLENLMPVGFANLRAVYAPSNVAVIANGLVTYWKYANIGNVDYIFSFTNDGRGYQTNLSTYATTQFAAAGSFTGTVALAQWKNERVLIIAANGYWSWDTATLTSLGGVTGAPSAGQTIACFAGRVWIGNGRAVTGSAPNSYTDFQIASSGFTFVITDETLNSTITAMFVGNGFLYIFGNTSINVISDVRLDTSVPPITLFSNTPVVTMIGSQFQMAIFPFMRLVAFATPVGFYALNGATPIPLSENLDDIIPDIDFTKPVSGGVANLFNKVCAAFSFTYNDPIYGTRALMAIYFNKRWFFGNQGSLRLVTGAFVGGKPAMFGTDGALVYKLFDSATLPIVTRLSTALWMMDEPTRTKQALKAGVEMTVTNPNTSISLTVDTNYGSVATTVTTDDQGNWINAAGVTGLWQNALGTTGQWIGTGTFQIWQGDAEAYGRYAGYSISSNSPAYRVNGLLMQFEKKASWASRP